MIYDELFAAKHEKISRLPLPGLNDLLVSKRIYAIARPAWLHSFRATLSARRVDRVVAGLWRDEEACAALRFFEIKVFANHENTTAAVLERLSNVRYLRLSFDKGQRRVTGERFLFPKSLVEGLAQMPSLRRLDLLDPVHFKTEFPVGALRLRHVKTTIENISPTISTLLQQCAVQHLVMIVGDRSSLSIGNLPWASLQQLRVRFEEYVEESAATDLLKLLRAQVRVAGLLRSFSLQRSVMPVAHIYVFLHHMRPDSSTRTRDRSLFRESASKRSTRTRISPRSSIRPFRFLRLAALRASVSRPLARRSLVSWALSPVTSNDWRSSRCRPTT